MEPLYLLTLEDVLLDTSTTVVPAIQQTIQDYFSRYLGVRGHGLLASAEDIAAFQRVSGFATPWMMAAAMVRVALAHLPPGARSGRAPEDMRRAIAALQSRARSMRSITLEALRERTDFVAAAAQIQEGGGGWAGARKVVGKIPHPLFIADADPAGINVVRRLFLEIFLGQEGFARVGGGSAELSRTAGLLPNVAPRLPLETVRGWRKAGSRVALIAPWPAEIIQLLLPPLGAASLLDYLLTDQDLVAESARARRLDLPDEIALPHPWLVEEAARTLDPSGERPCRLIAARPDAIRAAVRAARPVEAWALIPATGDPAPWQAALAEAGAARIIAEPAALATRQG